MHYKGMVLVLAGLLLIACKQNPLKVDVSDVDVKITLQRLDKDLFKYQARHDSTLLDSLQDVYGPFFELYNKQVIGLGNPDWKTYPNHLNAFLSDFRVQQAKKRTEKVFNGLKWLEEDLTNAFKHFRYYFPEKPIPSVYTMITGFNYSVVTDSAMIGIGLDKYLGRNYYFYGRLGWPDYQRYKMFKAKIPSDVLQAYGMMEFPYQDTSDNLINRMLYEGKIKYFVKAMFPEQPDSLIFAYSKNQMKWCRDNESYVWAYFVDKKLLFSKKQMIYKKYLEEGPFTSSFTRKAPARIGIWIGYQIVREYMKNYPEVSLAALMNDHRYQALLNRSGYDP